MKVIASHNGLAAAAKARELLLAGRSPLEACVAGVTLVEIEPYWARAWARVLLGRPPWGVRAEGTASRNARGRSSGRSTTETTNAARATTTSIWETLGITARATADDLKRAFRQRALATNPDRGGDAEAFRQVQSAFKEAQRRIARRPTRTRAR